MANLASYFAQAVTHLKRRDWVKGVPRKTTLIHQYQAESCPLSVTRYRLFRSCVRHPTLFLWVDFIAKMLQRLRVHQHVKCVRVPSCVCGLQGRSAEEAELIAEARHRGHLAHRSWSTKPKNFPLTESTGT